IVGLYDNNGAIGVMATFPRDTPAVGAEWSAIFEDPALNSFRHHTEAAIVASLESVADLPGFPDTYIDIDATTLMETYGGRDDVYRNASSFFDMPPMNTPYGDEAALLSFSSATFTGTVTVSVVPEPGASFLCMAGVGLGMAVRWRKSGSQP
ncbi:MAG: hypothetical protein RID07_17460, partial [Lacipirellulaceae bacterium]